MKGFDAWRFLAAFKSPCPPALLHATPRAMALTLEHIPPLARLARLHIPTEQHDAVLARLNKTLAFVEQLSAVDTTGVPPLTSVADLTLPLRDDIVTDGNQPDSITANAPETTHHFFVVPKVVE
jgi:aspartyl-tRNA(Asn)/glutamyl-tRNA(Gln) amidotransferase subunit C